jgi:hypothetical protein
VNTIRRTLVLVIATLATMAGLSLSVTQSANAVQLYGASGSYGSITPYQVVGGTTNTCSVGTCYQRQVRVPGPTVGRSPSATAAQQLRIQYRVYRYNGSSWALYSSVTRNYNMGYYSAIRLQQENFNTGTGYFSVQMSLSWHLSSTGAFLGGRGVNYNGNDYACSSALACNVATGWVHFG